MTLATPRSCATIASIAELHAHLLELRHESAELYEEFASNMLFHNNEDAASLFAELGARARQAASRAAAASEGHALPKLRPWEYKWPNGQSPAYIPFEELHYLMHRHHALQLALEAEHNVERFLYVVSQQSPSQAVRDFAASVLVPQREHLRLLEGWLRECPVPEDGWDDDSEPPLIVE